MLAPFSEAIRATVQPCTLLLVLPALIMAVLTRGRWPAFAATCFAAVAGGWLFVANVVALSGATLRLSGAVVGAVILLMLFAPRAAPLMTWLRWADSDGARAAGAGVVMFIATQWWRPCIGSELGQILTDARDGMWPVLLPMAAYMLGAMVPVLAVVLVMRVADPQPSAAARVSWIAGAFGLCTALALVVGRHDELVTALTRWTGT